MGAELIDSDAPVAGAVGPMSRDVFPVAGSHSRNPDPTESVQDVRRRFVTPIGLTPPRVNALDRETSLTIPEYRPEPPPGGLHESSAPRAEDRGRSRHCRRAAVGWRMCVRVDRGTGGRHQRLLVRRSDLRVGRAGDTAGLAA